ncbi:MAG: protein kinase, partial [Candidatus Adiutrix sp.]|nr:protein kinase [Candidatus Adiutrix sp.]
MASLKLILTADSGGAGRWEFECPRTVLIGRDEKADVIPPPEEKNIQSLSAYHAVIELGGEQAVIRDLGSLNGTWVNGHLTGERDDDPRHESGVPVYGPGAALADGDILNLGELVFRVSILDEADVEASSAAGQQASQRCPGCGMMLQPREISKYPDSLCKKCRSNPVSALKLLQAGLSRRIKALDSLKGLRIARLLGRGATSAVFLAVRKNSGARLALKVMPPLVSDNDWARKSFLREAAIGRALKHPNVVRIYDFGFYGGAYFFLMEYCPGGTSEEYRTREGGFLTPEEALKIVIPALDGLGYLHNVKLATVGVHDPEAPEAVGLVHRDLKPANIFLGGENSLVPKIADIGVGKFYGHGGSCHTRTGSVAGSPATMPRQQAMNFKYAGPEVDVWAAAASLFKLVTGEYPREFPSARDPWQVVMKDKPRQVRQL